MRCIGLMLFFLFYLLNNLAIAQLYSDKNELKPEVIISYDPGTYDNDDFQSFMVNLLEDIAYIQFDMIIIGFGWNMKPDDYQKGLEQFHRMVNKIYAPSLPLLRKSVGQEHDEEDENEQRMFSYPSVEHVKDLICLGSTLGGMEGIKQVNTPATDRIIEILRRDDSRKVDLVTGGGAIDYIIALQKAANLHDFGDIKKRLGWIISISDQSMSWDSRTNKSPFLYYTDPDNPAHYIRKNVPWIRNRWVWLQKTFNTSISITRKPDFTSFITTFIQSPINKHDPEPTYLNLFPDRDETYDQVRTGFMGDQPCLWLGYKNGLTDRRYPWRGGNLQVQKEYHKWDSTLIFSDLSWDNRLEEKTVSWVELMIKPYFHQIANKVKIINEEAANRSPVVILNGDATTNVLYKRVKTGELVTLSTEGSFDPDGDSLYHKWFVTNRSSHAYSGKIELNPGIKRCSLTIPEGSSGKEISVIVQVTDLTNDLDMEINNEKYQKPDGSWMGTSFRRIILQVE